MRKFDWNAIATDAKDIFDSVSNLGVGGMEAGLHYTRYVACPHSLPLSFAIISLRVSSSRKG